MIVCFNEMPRQTDHRTHIERWEEWAVQVYNSRGEHSRQSEEAGKSRTIMWEERGKDCDNKMSERKERQIEEQESERCMWFISKEQ